MKGNIYFSRTCYTALVNTLHAIFKTSENNIRCLSTSTLGGLTNSEARRRRNILFSEEQKRQKENVGRIEKIEVRYTGTPEDLTLSMNKNISTPFDCSQHMSEMLMLRSALALIDDSVLWDMHRPLESDCQLKLLHFKEADPHHVNKAFWRTCSLILGAVAEKVFKDDIYVKLHSFPSPNVKSGSFVYDVDVHLNSWQATQDELRIISGEMVKLCREEHKIERLVVGADLAADMFADNKHKTQQIPHIASQNSSSNEVVLYRVGDHIDISRGPMVADTSFIGRCTVTAVHRIENEQGELYRFQGVALPKGFLLNHFAYGILESRAKNLNSARQPAIQTNTDTPLPSLEALAS